MTAIDRTAYPRLGARLTHEELGARYTLTEADLTFVRGSTRGEAGRLMLAMLLKTRQDFGCFPAINEIHPDTVAHLALQLGLTAPVLSGRVEDGRSGLGHPASPCFPSPLIKPYVPISGIPAFRLASPRAYGGRMLRASSVFPPRLGVAIQLVRKAPGLTRCFTGLRQVTDPRLL